VKRSTPVPPFRVISEGAVHYEQGGWTVYRGDRVLATIAGGDVLPDWDAQLEFRMERRLVIGDALVRDLWGDASGAGCEVLVVGTTGTTKSREILCRLPVPDQLPSTLTVSVTPTSAELARFLQITTTICLREDSRPEDPLAPTRAGSRLWEDAETFRLEGGRARLAMYEADFSRMWSGQGLAQAICHVEIRDDPDLDFESAVVVYVNAAKRDFIDALVDDHKEAQRLLWASVVRRVLMAAGFSDWNPGHSPSVDGTLGTTAMRWARQVCNCDTLEALREQLENRFSEVDAGIDALVETILGAAS